MKNTFRGVYGGELGILQRRVLWRQHNQLILLPSIYGVGRKEGTRHAPDPCQHPVSVVVAALNGKQRTKRLSGYVDPVRHFTFFRALIMPLIFAVKHRFFDASSGGFGDRAGGGMTFAPSFGHDGA